MGDANSRLRTHASLLVRLRDLTDAEAWRQFVDVYAPLVYRWCRGQGLQEADAADVGQEVLTQVARSIQNFEYQPERGLFRSWLGTVVRSKLANFHNKQARHAPVPASAEALAETPAPAADTQWEAEFNAHVVQVALARIRPDFLPTNWRAFEMTWLEDQPPATVAKALGMTPSAVNVVKWRVLRQSPREEVLALAEDVPHLVPLGEHGEGD